MDNYRALFDTGDNRKLSIHRAPDKYAMAHDNENAEGESETTRPI